MIFLDFMVHVKRSPQRLDDFTQQVSLIIVLIVASIVGFVFAACGDSRPLRRWLIESAVLIGWMSFIAMVAWVGDFRLFIAAVITPVAIILIATATAPALKRAYSRRQRQQTLNARIARNPWEPEPDRSDHHE